jgi:hypothetical protein
VVNKPGRRVEICFRIRCSHQQLERNNSARRRDSHPNAFKALPVLYLAKAEPNIFGGWVIHKECFCAPKIPEVAHLKAWTLKPEVRKD